MSDEIAGRIRTLTAEYVALVEAMRGGQFADQDEWRTLSSQRSLVHNELIALTGVTDRRQMYAYCRELLAASE